MIRLPPDAEIVVNHWGELPNSCQTVLVIRSPHIEVEARWDTATRLYQIWASALHRDGQRSHAVAVRSAPHVRGVQVFVGGLIKHVGSSNYSSCFVADASADATA